MNVVPEKNINFSVYLDGEDLLGVAEATIPNLEYMTETVKGAGIAGEFDSVVLGHFGSISLSLNWRNVTDSAVKLLAPKAHNLDLYGAIQDYDAGTGQYAVRQIHLYCKAVPKGFDMGKFSAGEAGDSASEFELHYLLVERDGTKRIELDKFNYIFVVDGIDYLAEVRKALGKG
jgi:hypothetical protein